MVSYYEHTAIALVGGGTTLVGDPSGKDKSRKILKEDIDGNISKMKKFLINLLILIIDHKLLIIMNGYQK